MTRVLIVSRTLMHAGICVGGFSVEGRQNVRLLPPSGGHSHPASAPYQIGQVWEMELRKPAEVVPPHVEDMLVVRAERTSEINDMEDWLSHNAIVIAGDCSALFGGLLHASHAGSVYIGEVAVPQFSVGFWRPLADLRYDPTRRKYQTAFGVREVAIAYVGEAPASPVIPAGSLVRVSLARWYSPGQNSFEACWLQVSG